MIDYSNEQGFLDSVYTEIEVDQLPQFIKSVSVHDVDALVVLGPDTNSSDVSARTLLTMYPWSLHRPARAIAATPSAEAAIDSAPLVSWMTLKDQDVGAPGWPTIWQRHGYQSMLTVKIPIAMGRHFECLLFSKAATHARESAAELAYKTMEAWPGIKKEIANKQQLLTRQERLILEHSAYGATSQQAAERCDTSERMVNFHIGNSLRKLNVPNKTAAVLKAIMMGIF